VQGPDDSPAGGAPAGESRAHTDESEGSAPRPATARDPQRSRRWFRPPSIRASLVIGALIPLIVAFAISSVVVLGQSSSRQQAVSAAQSSLALDSLLRARVSVYEEYVPSAAIVAAQANHITEAQLDSLLHTDFQADLVKARQQVDTLAVPGPKGQFGSARAQLVALRHEVDQKTATPLEVETFFNALGSRIDDQWQDTFDQLQSHSQSSGSLATRSRITALGTTFAAFTSGIAEENLQGGGSLESVLATSATPEEVQSLIVSHQQFQAATHDFPSQLGPHGAKAWTSLTQTPVDTQFVKNVQLAIAVGLAHGEPPLATNPAGIGAVAQSEVAWAASLSNLVLATSADLRSATATQANAASQTLYFTLIGVVLLLLAEIAAVLLLGREVRRPLDRIVVAATLIREGELEFPELDESGPKELALAAAAFNEMSSTLRSVQEQAIALSKVDLDDPVLRRSLPGRTGAALQSALMTLQASVRTNENRRAALAERATRDSLTGLLNRGAALEALRLDLASVHRSNGDLELTVLFIDLDELKTINDTFGHDRGDAAIQSVAEALKSATRTSDVVARLGGDEFIVGSLEGRGFGASELLARRIDASLSDLRLGNTDDHVAVGCSIGVAVSEPSDDRVEVLIDRADRALYVAKAKGRGQVSWSASS
jgi:diguanylate cyclase (GGDEF)-like protein